MPNYTGAFNMAANTAAKYGENKMDPVTISALIGAGTSLAKGMFGKDENEEQRKWLDQRRREKISAFKPKTPYYETFKNLPALANTMQKMIYGNLGERLGPEMLQKWGINLEDLNKTLGMDKPFSQSPEGLRFGGQYPGMPTMQNENPYSRLTKRYVDDDLGLQGSAPGPSRDWRY